MNPLHIFARIAAAVVVVISTTTMVACSQSAGAERGVDAGAQVPGESAAETK